MSESVTLYAINDWFDKLELVKAKGRITKGFYCIDDTEGGHWPHKLRMRRESAYYADDESDVHLTPSDAIKSYLAEQQETCQKAERSIAKATEMLSEIDQEASN